MDTVNTNQARYNILARYNTQVTEVTEVQP